ncbi:hypothetical protein [Kaistia nematophila]|uniref:Uncharacterized protein n=1 Tax=Kaistia nematophila TaxID=2994654 RepID=A0A9X3DYK2_9HYPH|nr:hypothetical protein [Kaistia nematophila]MCX5568137.1 hypothetical protein [Kaistia nematophila]
MFTLLVRLLGLFAIAGAVVGLVIDGTKSIAASTLTVTPLGQAWFAFDPASLNALQAAVATHVEVYVGPWVWSPVIQFLLTLPTWLVLGAIGTCLLLAGRRRRYHSVVA